VQKASLCILEFGIPGAPSQDRHPCFLERRHRDERRWPSLDEVNRAILAWELQGKLNHLHPFLSLKDNNEVRG
jgi:hypothetical protein